MSIPHLKARAEFYALCLEHGEENVEWWIRGFEDVKTTAAKYAPDWIHDGRVYHFGLRPRTVVLPEAVVPEEYPGGRYCCAIATWEWVKDKTPQYCYHQSMTFNTAADRDAVVAAMLAREVKR